MILYFKLLYKIYIFISNYINSI